MLVRFGAGHRHLEAGIPAVFTGFAPAPVMRGKIPGRLRSGVFENSGGRVEPGPGCG